MKINPFELILTHSHIDKTHLLIWSWFYKAKRFEIMHSNSSYFSKLKLIKNHRNKNEASVWVYWSHNHICVFDINAHNDQSCTGIEPALLSSTIELTRTALTIWPRKPRGELNNEKYTDIYKYIEIWDKGLIVPQRRTRWRYESKTLYLKQDWKERTCAVEEEIFESKTFYRKAGWNFFQDDDE